MPPGACRRRVATSSRCSATTTPSLTWSNPFIPVVPGSDTGQLALPPDNQFHQLVATLGYEITPTIRFSGDIAFGRMTQDDVFLPADG